MAETEAPAPGQNLTEFDFWDVSNSRAVINLLPVKVTDQFRESYTKRPELFGIGEHAVKTKLRENNEVPNITDNRLRLNFWLEYEIAQMSMKPMRVPNIVAGIVSTNYFMDRYLKVPSKVAWLLTPPSTYEIVVTEALYAGMEKMREILDYPDTLPDGRLNMKLLEMKQKITAMVDLRIKGLPTQKIEQKTIGFTMNMAAKDVSSAGAEGNMEQLQKRIKELEQRERRALNMPDPEPLQSKEVTRPTPDDIDAEFKPA